MKRFYIKKTCTTVSFIALLCCNVIVAQVGINTTAPNGILDVNSSIHGIVLPRIALTKTNLKAPVVNPNGVGPSFNLAVGTVVFNTNTTATGSNDVSPGIYVWTGSEWFNKFTRKHAQFFMQSGSGGFEALGGMRTTSTGGYATVTALGSQNFTAKYTGTYKIEVSVNYGGGTIENHSPNTDILSQEADFMFTFNGSTEVISMSAISTNNNGYFAIWEQASIVLYKSLTAGVSYNFKLEVDQNPSPEHINNGDSGRGRGYVGLDIPCSVEFIFIGD